ncbi:allatotropins-like [Tachypleus tridentatus]|uniref:allatotropins-like n=1 Tax=Tachypleus tridentatus TaxID=6853 RepID=UPI003FCF044F
MFSLKIYVVVIACFLTVTADALPTGALSRQERGFRNAALSTARGFGKRTFQHSEDNGFDGSIPLDWFVDQLNRNPILARLVAEKIVDLNGDGFLSRDELYKVV